MKSKTRKYLIIEGERFPVSGISYDGEGNIISVQVAKDFMVQGFVNLDSTLEGYEKVDFEKCFVEEYPGLLEKLEVHMKCVKSDIDELAHMAIPSISDEIDIDELKNVWMSYHFLTQYYDGLNDALCMIQGKKEEDIAAFFEGLLRRLVKEEE